MKNIVKRVLSFMMVLMLVVMAVPVDVKADYDPTNARNKKEIKITGATPYDEFVAYQIMDITYDSESRSVTYKWKDDIASLIIDENGDQLTVDEFYAKYPGNTATIVEKRQKILAKIPSSNVLTTPSLTNGVANEQGEVIWEDVSIGGYLIVPISTTDVYQMMLAIVQPQYSEADSDYVTIGSEIGVKREKIGITKKVNGEEEKSTTGAKQTVTYTIEVDVPKYKEDIAGDIVDTTFVIVDKLSEGLVLNGDSLKVYGITIDSNGDEVSNQFTLNTQYKKGGVVVITDDSISDKYSNPTFVLEFDYSKINSYEKIKVEYKAQLSDDADKGKAGEHTNDVVLKYSNYPFKDGSYAYAEDSVMVSTYKLEIEKKDAENESKSLSGAEFEVYLKVPDGDLTAINLPIGTAMVDGGEAGIKQLNEGEYVYVGEMVDNNDGKYFIDKLDKGEYYLVETVVPKGYTMPIDAFGPFMVGDASGDDEAEDTAYVIEIYTKVTNSQGFTLPETGGTGTVIFTVVGVSLMCVAVLAFFILRKKEMNKN